MLHVQFFQPFAAFSFVFYFLLFPLQFFSVLFSLSSEKPTLPEKARTHLLSKWMQQLPPKSRSGSHDSAHCPFNISHSISGSLKSCPCFPSQCCSAACSMEHQNSQAPAAALCMQLRCTCIKSECRLFNQTSCFLTHPLLPSILPHL